MSNYLVFGARSAIARALSQSLLAKGHTVFGSTREEAHFQELRDSGVHPVLANLADKDSFKKCVDTALAHGPLDGVALCMGSIFLKPVTQVKHEDWEDTLNINLKSAFYTLQCSIPALIQNGGGSMVFVSSIAAQLGLANHEVIAAAKGGLEAMLRSAAASYAAKNIRINAVAPSLTRTPMSARFSEAVFEASRKMHPLQRLGEAHDIASAMEFLLLPTSSWISGQVLAVDGGMSRLK